MSTRRLRLRDPRELLAAPGPDSSSTSSCTTTTSSFFSCSSCTTSYSSRLAMASAAPSQPKISTTSPTSISESSSSENTQQQKTVVPQRTSAHSVSREGDPGPKRKRIIQTAEETETPATKISKKQSDAQDILARVCSAVGIDSDLAESVVEDPLPNNQPVSPRESQIPPGSVHYIRGVRPGNPPGTPQGTPGLIGPRLRHPDVRLVPNMHPAFRPPHDGSYPGLEGRPHHPQYHHHPAESVYAVRHRFPLHPGERHSYPGIPHYPGRYPYARHMNPVSQPINRLPVLRSAPHGSPVSPERYPHFEPHHSSPRGVQSGPRPGPPALHHDVLPRPPELYHAQVGHDVRHVQPPHSEVSYRLQSHHNISNVSPHGTEHIAPTSVAHHYPSAGQHNLVRPELHNSSHARIEQHRQQNPNVSLTPGTHHFQHAVYPIKSHDLRSPNSCNFTPPQNSESYGKHPYFSYPESSRDSKWSETSSRAHMHAHPSPEDRHRIPLSPRAPYIRSEQHQSYDPNWGLKRPLEGSERSPDSLQMRRLREPPKPCVELIPIGPPAQPVREKKPMDNISPTTINKGLPLKQDSASQNLESSSPSGICHSASPFGASGDIADKTTGKQQIQSLSAARVHSHAQSKTDDLQSSSHHTVISKSADRHHSTQSPVSDHPAVPKSQQELNNKSEDIADVVQEKKEIGRLSDRSLSVHDKNTIKTMEGTSSQLTESAAKSASKSPKDDPEKEVIFLKEKFPCCQKGVSGKDVDSNENAVPQPMGPGQLHCLHTTKHLPPSRSASEPLIRISGRDAVGARPASLPGTNRSSHSDEVTIIRLPEAESSEAKTDLKNKKEITNTCENDTDDAFVNRLSLVLNDLVSVPEATMLQQLSASPDQLLASLVRRRGAQSSTDADPRQRLRQNFLTMVKLCLSPSVLTAWGWDSSTPEEILDQLVKVVHNGVENVNGSVSSTPSVPQDDVLEDDVFVPPTHNGPPPPLRSSQSHTSSQQPTVPHTMPQTQQSIHQETHVRSSHAVYTSLYQESSSHGYPSIAPSSQLRSHHPTTQTTSSHMHYPYPTATTTNTTTGMSLAPRPPTTHANDLHSNTIHRPSHHPTTMHAHPPPLATAHRVHPHSPNTSPHLSYPPSQCRASEPLTPNAPSNATHPQPQYAYDRAYVSNAQHQVANYHHPQMYSSYAHTYGPSSQNHVPVPHNRYHTTYPHAPRAYSHTQVPYSHPPVTYTHASSPQSQTTVPTHAKPSLAQGYDLRHHQSIPHPHAGHMTAPQETAVRRGTARLQDQRLDEEERRGKDPPNIPIQYQDQKLCQNSQPSATKWAGDACTLRPSISPAHNTLTSPT